MSLDAETAQSLERVQEALRKVRAATEAENALPNKLREEAQEEDAKRAMDVHVHRISCEIEIMLLWPEIEKIIEALIPPEPPPRDPKNARFVMPYEHGNYRRMNATHVLCLDCQEILPKSGMAHVCPEKPCPS